MDLQTKVLYIFLDLILPMGIGFLLKQQQYLSEDFFDRMIKLSMFLLYPLLSVLTFWVLPLSLEFIWLPILGVVMVVVGGAVAWWQASKKFADPKEIGSYIIAAMLSNILTLGGLCVYILYGERGYAYTNLMQLLQTVILFLFCYPLAQYYRSQSDNTPAQQTTLFSVLFHRNQLPVLGLIMGIGLYLSGLERPAWIAATVDPLVHVSAWAALVPVGYSIMLSKIKEYGRAVADMVWIKFLVIPLVTSMAAWFVIEDKVAFRSVIILSSTPTAVSAVIAAKINDINVHVSMATFIITTVLFLGVVFPLLFLFLS